VLVCLESVGDVLDVFKELLVVVVCSCVGCGVEDFSDVVEDVTVVEVIGDVVEELVLAVEELVVDEDTTVGVPAVSKKYMKILTETDNALFFIVKLS
jgi:hypothetical protein